MKRSQRPQKPKPRRDYRFDPCQESFTCKNCGWLVTPAGAGTRHRNHCPNCLCSRHVDEEPGARAWVERTNIRPGRGTAVVRSFFIIIIDVSGPCPLQQDPHMEGEIEHNQRQNNAQQDSEKDSHSMPRNLPQRKAQLQCPQGQNGNPSGQRKQKNQKTGERALHIPAIPGIMKPFQHWKHPPQNFGLRRMSSP